MHKLPYIAQVEFWQNVALTTAFENYDRLACFPCCQHLADHFMNVPCPSATRLGISSSTACINNKWERGFSTD